MSKDNNSQFQGNKLEATNKKENVRNDTMKNSYIALVYRVFKTLANIPERIKEGEICHICKQQLSQEQEQICNFCGRRVCGDCSPKKRQNPQKQDNFVRICDKCDFFFLKEMLTQDKYQQDQLIKKQLTQEEENEINLKQKLMELQTDLDHSKTKFQSEKGDNYEKLEGVTSKYEKRREKVNNLQNQKNEVDKERRQIEENMKQIEKNHSNLLDEANRELFERTKLEKAEIVRDKYQLELQNFIYKQNSNITSQNLIKNDMDSVLVRKQNDSKFNQSDYDIFQETPNTPFDQKFLFESRASQSLLNTKEFVYNNKKI